MNDALLDQVARTVDRQRLIDTAVALVEVPSPTRSAGPAADRLAEILSADGFSVQRHDADWPQAPIVMTALDSGRAGPTLQFDGHLDTVHLPYVPPRVENDTLYGSSSADMKGGIAAALEALRVLRTLDALPAGRVLFTAHDHHEGPWGDGRQVRAMIREGLVGDAVMLPEYLASPLPVAGRGLAIFRATIHRDGEPVHEVLRPPGTPDVVAAGADVFNLLLQVLDDGRLTDSQGRVIDFRHTVLVMTSNIASRQILAASGESAGEEALAAAIDQALKAKFRPEFLNRIDEVIRFQPLGPEQILPIVELQLQELGERLAEQNLRLQVDGEVVKALAQDGYDPEFGARPLRRVLRRRLENPLAMEVLGERFTEVHGVRVQLRGDGTLAFVALH